MTRGPVVGSGRPGAALRPSDGHVIQRRSTLEEALGDLAHLEEDCGGILNGAFMCEDGHLEAIVTLLENGYTFDRSRDWLRLVPPIAPRVQRALESLREARNP